MTVRTAVVLDDHLVVISTWQRRGTVAAAIP
jgi:hypothetical protein